MPSARSKLFKVPGPSNVVRVERFRRDLRELHDLEGELKALGRARTRTRAAIRTLKKRIEVTYSQIAAGATLIIEKPPAAKGE